MIAFVKGTILSIDFDEIVVLTPAGVGYRMAMPQRELEELRLNDEVEIHTATLVKEDAITLAGFLTPEERKLFTKLITVSGVGPKLALDILNAFTPVELQNAVLARNTHLLSKVPRVGAKKAEKLVIDLDTIMKNSNFLPPLEIQTKNTPKLNNTSDETRSALLNLGFSDSRVNEAIKALENEKPDLLVNDAIRWTLAWLQNR